jgi:hypothetical protein
MRERMKLQLLNADSLLFDAQRDLHGDPLLAAERELEAEMEVSPVSCMPPFERWACFHVCMHAEEEVGVANRKLRLSLLPPPPAGTHSNLCCLPPGTPFRPCPLCVLSWDRDNATASVSC